MTAVRHFAVHFRLKGIDGGTDYEKAGEKGGTSSHTGRPEEGVRHMEGKAAGQANRLPGGRGWEVEVILPGGEGLWDGPKTHYDWMAHNPPIHRCSPIRGPSSSES